jgi:polysaccharide export outer membrane protein
MTARRPRPGPNSLVNTVMNPPVKLTRVIVASLLMLSAVSRAQETTLPVGKIALPGLAPGDQLNVRLYDFPDLGSGVMVRVGADGAVHLPYAGTIQALGMSPDGLERAITESLQEKGIVKQPSVTVDVLSAVNFTVNVLGQVQTPKAIPLFAPAPLSFVLTQVGGITGLADHHLTILSRGDQLPTSVDYDPDSPNGAALRTLVQPGDIVTVSSRGVFFVGGEVNHPGIYPMGGALSVGQVTSNNGLGVVHNITLLEALSQAGGITAIAARSKMHLLRTENGKRIDIVVDQVKLSKGQVADPILHPNDIIYLEPSYFRQQTNNLFSTAISSVYAAATVRESNF